jgi:hypothetical protein
MSYTIKHMGLGGILDQAIAIVRDNFVLLFTIMLFLLIPFTLVQGFLVLSITPELPPNPTPQDIMEWQQEQMRHFPWIIGIGLLLFIVVYPITNAAVIQAVARLYLGQPVTAIEAIKHAVRRFGPLIGTTILMSLAIWGGLILCIIPGIYFAIWFGLSQHVVVLEGISGTSAMKRSKQLVHKDRGTFLALGIIMFVITLALSAAANWIPQPHLSVVVAAVIQALTTMLWTAAFVVFYFSCRCGVENFDLHYLAESIAAEPADADQPVAPANRTR